MSRTNLGRGCRRPHHFLVAAPVSLLLLVGVLVAEPPLTGRGRPRDGRLSLAGTAAVLPCIVGVGGPRGRRGGEVVSRPGTAAAAAAAEDYGLRVVRGAKVQYECDVCVCVCVCVKPQTDKTKRHTTVNAS